MLKISLAKVGLIIIIVIYLGLTQFYNAAIPFSKGPDELTHYLYALFIGEHGRLPITTAERAETSTRAYLPPLYHLPVGLLMALTRRSYPPPAEVSPPPALYPTLKTVWESPTRQLIDIVLPRATLIRTEDERLPFRGEYLAWAVGRWVSTILSAGTIILTFWIGHLIWPQRPGLALLAAALVAFNPMFLFISAVLNDDNMVGLTMAGYLLLLVWFLQGKDGTWLYLSMGLLIGLAVTTKYNTGLAALSTAFVMALVRRRRDWHWRDWARRVGLVWLAVILGSAWWLVWNEIYFNEVAEYGLIAGALKPFVPDVDPTANRLVSFFSNSLADPGLPQGGNGTFWDWLRRTFETTWSITVFGVKPYAGYWLLISVLAGLTVATVAGLWFFFRQNNSSRRLWVAAFLLHFVVVLPLPLIRFFMTHRINDTAQGRHLFYPAAPAIVILLLTGWDYWLRPAYKKWAGLSGAGLLLLWAMFHGWYLWRAYPPPLPVRTSPGPQMVTTQTTQLDFGQVMRLCGYQLQTIEQNSVLQLDLIWHSLSQAYEDYQTEITLVDRRQRPQLRWISQPVQGRFPVRAWQPGDTIRDTLYLPLAGLMPGEYEVQLRLLGWDRPLPSTQGEVVSLGSLTLESTPAADGVTLWQQNHAITEPPARLFASAGASNRPTYRYRATIPVTAPPGTAVTLVGPDDQARPPVSDLGTLRTFLVDYDWPSGNYRLQLDGQLQDLTVRIENFDTRPDSWNFTLPEMMVSTQANFAGQIELLGYDLPLRRVEAGQGIPLVLYWRGLARMREDYTISVQLLDAEQQRRGGYDRFPRETYNTYLWVPGEIVDDGFAVPVDSTAPDGVYTIRIGLYHRQDGEITELPLVQDGQPLAGKSVVIGPIKVGGPPPAAILSTQELATDPPQSPSLASSNNLGQPPLISLRGYDLVRQETSLQIRLYWESLAETPVDWSIFVHLRDSSGQTITQKDGPAGSGRYPSSLWEPGEIISDEILLPLPAELPRGQYHLVVGLYDLATGRRLPVPEAANDEMLLTSLELPQ